MSDKQGRGVNCYKCKFFQITWDSQFPYACKAYGFKGRNLPCLEVLSASGSACMYFESKPQQKKQPDKRYPDYI